MSTEVMAVAHLAVGQQAVSLLATVVVVTQSFSSHGTLLVRLTPPLL